MIITCQECNSSFNVDDSLIKETGSKVRCSKCEHVFVTYPYSPEDDLLLDSDEQLLGSDGSSELDDLDSTLDGFFGEEESPVAPDAQKDADDELGLGLGLDPQFDSEEDTAAPAFETEKSERAVDDLENKLDMDQDQASEDTLEDSHGASDHDIYLNDGGAEESMIDDELPNKDTNTDFETPVTADSENLKLDFLLGSENDTREIDEPSDDDLALENAEDPDLSDLELEDNDALEAESALTENSVDPDLDLLLNQDSETQADDEIADPAMAVEETDELDLSDLDLEGDDIPSGEIATGEDAEDLDFDLMLDQDSENQADDEIADPAMAVEETDELDLSDLDLEGDDIPSAEIATGEDAEDLDFDLMLDQDSENQADDEIADPAMAVEETDELDLSDLDLESSDTSATADDSGENSEELDLDLNLESETVASDPDAFGDELDLSDLEEIIDSESDDADFNMPETPELNSEQKDDQEIQAVDATAAVEDDDELDFSDLDKMLESSETAEAPAESDETDELDLQFDIDEPTPGKVDTTASINIDDGDLEDGLLDIEKMLEDNEDAADNDMDSPLEMEATFDNASKAEPEEDLELDFDLESELQEKEDLFDGNSTADEHLESNLLTSDETEIEESEFEAEEFQGSVTTDEFATDELLETSDTYSGTNIPPLTDGPASAPAAMMPKSRSKKPVLVALLLLFLAGGILIVPNMLGIKIPYISDIKIPYLSDLDIKIPYLSEKLNPKEKDEAGNIKIIPLAGTINAKFVNDSQGGQRFVIYGKIKNDYDHPRSFIKVTGKIYQKGGKLVKTETVYCGNVLSDSEISGMKIAAVNKRLLNRFGDKKSNLKVKTGNTIPFMIVFDKLPQNLDEYTVEVDESSI